MCVRTMCYRSEEPTYEAVWADKHDFNEVLISPTMINDHWPDNVLDALEKVGIHSLLIIIIIIIVVVVVISAIFCTIEAVW